MAEVNVWAKGIKEIYETRGVEAFTDARMFNALLDDLVPGVSNERKIIHKTVDDALLKDLFSMVTDNSADKQLGAMKIIKKIEDSCGLSSKYSCFIVETFCTAFDVSVNLHTDDIVSSNIMPRVGSDCFEKHDADSNTFKKCVLDDGSVYEGDFVNGKRIGKGKLTWPSGEVYEGNFVNGKIIGKGKYTWPNGEVYEGDFVNGKRTGKGKLTWANGDVYEGDFRNGKITGKGKYTWANGDVYEGDFRNGKITGKGIKTLANGTNLKGVFENGILKKKSMFFF